MKPLLAPLACTLLASAALASRPDAGRPGTTPSTQRPSTLPTNFASALPEATSKPEAQTANALLEMLQMPYRRPYGDRPSPIICNTRGRLQIMRMVELLRHPDKRMRQGAFDLLTNIQPDRPGEADNPEAWETWLKNELQRLGIEPPKWVMTGWKPIEDLFFDIIEIRVRNGVDSFQWTWKAPDPTRPAVLTRLVEYLRHPDGRVRTAAFSTLTSLQYDCWTDCPGGPDEPGAWERWLAKNVTNAVAWADRGREQAAAVKAGSIESLDGAWLEMVKMPHFQLGGMPRSADILAYPDRRDVITRLVSLLRHPNKRVVQTALFLLTSVQPDRPAAADHPELWEAWLSDLQLQTPADKNAHKRLTQGWDPIEDVLFDILEIRINTQIGSKQSFGRDPKRHEPMARLIHYLRHPNRHVRSASHSTIICLQGDCPGPDPDLWDRWLKEAEEGIRGTVY